MAKSSLLHAASLLLIPLAVSCDAPAEDGKTTARSELQPRRSQRYLVTLADAKAVGQLKKHDEQVTTRPLPRSQGLLIEATLTGADGNIWKKWGKLPGIVRVIPARKYVYNFAVLMEPSTRPKALDKAVASWAEIAQTIDTKSPGLFGIVLTTNLKQSDAMKRLTQAPGVKIAEPNFQYKQKQP